LRGNLALHRDDSGFHLSRRGDQFSFRVLYFATAFARSITAFGVA
jgi:hypothetical protein